MKKVINTKKKINKIQNSGLKNKLNNLINVFTNKKI